MAPPAPGHRGDRRGEQGVADPTARADDPREALAQAPDGVERVDEQVSGGRLRVGVLAKTAERDVPRGERDGGRGEPEQVAAPSRCEEQPHSRGHREDDSRARERERDRYQCRRDCRPPFQGQDGPEAEGHRRKPADLKRPEKVFPAGPQEQKYQGRGQRDRLAGAAPDELEEQHDVGEVSDEEHGHVGRVRAQPGRAEQDRVDEPQEHHGVLVVGLEVGAKCPVRGRGDEGPLVEVEREGAGEPQQEGADDKAGGDEEPARARNANVRGRHSFRPIPATVFATASGRRRTTQRPRLGSAAASAARRTLPRSPPRAGAAGAESTAPRARRATRPGRGS